jgi:hypothetical protein
MTDFLEIVLQVVTRFSFSSRKGNGHGHVRPKDIHK